MSLDLCFERVREFHERFEHPVADAPVQLCADRVQKRADWLESEVVEFREAVDVAGQADAMIDIIYFALGGLVEMGVKPERLFDIVHAANMAKLWEDGRPRFRGDGKVIKPEGWRDPGPELEREILSQSAA
jgi:predicted HAD superfamily Cof-like phosphohydrolase